MTRAFGNLLREARSTAGKTLGDVADRLGVTVAYISSVERGVKAPLSEDKIKEVAGLLAISPNKLLAAAAQDRGEYVLNANHKSVRAREVGAALMREWTELSDKQLSDIGRIVEGRSKR